MKQRYLEKRFSAQTRSVLKRVNVIIDEYQLQGFVLTLRQLFYQLVARGHLPNTTQEYKRLGGIVSDGRLAGEIDWDAIEDRTRNLARSPAWDSPQDIVSAVAQQFRRDKWAMQPYRLEVWVEKEALAGIFERTCRSLQIPYIACRGYMSQSEMRAAGQRFLDIVEYGQTPVVLHLGDHDPSGIDMSRDIEDRIRLFMGDKGDSWEFHRLALNIQQVQALNPPPNPAKITDSRVGGYIKKFGQQSWELDALDPNFLDQLVRNFVVQYRNQILWDAEVQKEDEERRLLGVVARDWDKVTHGL